MRLQAKNARLFLARFDGLVSNGNDEGIAPVLVIPAEAGI